MIGIKVTFTSLRVRIQQRGRKSKTDEAEREDEVPELEDDGQASLRKAAALAAATARYALGAVPAEREIAPVTIEELVAVEGDLALPQEYELVLQLAVQGHDIPRPLDAVPAFVEQCRLTWK